MISKNINLAFCASSGEAKEQLREELTTETVRRYLESRQMNLPREQDMIWRVDCQKKLARLNSIHRHLLLMAALGKPQDQIAASMGFSVRSISRMFDLYGIRALGDAQRSGTRLGRPPKTGLRLIARDGVRVGF